jgi:hypothetical protein
MKIEEIALREYENVGDDKLFPNHTDKDIWIAGFKEGYLLAQTETNKSFSGDGLPSSMDLSDVIDIRTTSWDDIFQNVPEVVYRLPSGNYIPLKTYLKEKYYPPKNK